MSVTLVTIGERLLVDNDRVAAGNHVRLTQAGVFTVNLMAAPGAGKTSFIVGTMSALEGRARVGVIEGDIAGSIDAETVLAAGARGAVQINTGGNCHLEADMVERALPELDLSQIDMLFVENVGNLVCPTHWALGEHVKICLVGAAEGDDKPLKYPPMFAASDAVVLNKIDLIDQVDFDRAFFTSTVRALNPDAPIFEVSCRTGAGLADWADWLLGEHAAMSRG